MADICIDGDVPPVNAQSSLSRQGKPPSIRRARMIGVATAAPDTSRLTGQSPSGSSDGLDAAERVSHELAGSTPVPPVFTSSWLPPTTECHSWNVGLSVAVVGAPLIFSTVITVTT